MVATALAAMLTTACMAETLESRPDLRGLVAASSLRSPDCGVFERSRERERLYREGRFTPTTGLVVWPRADMLRWWRSYKVAVA